MRNLESRCNVELSCEKKLEILSVVVVGGKERGGKIDRHPDGGSVLLRIEGARNDELSTNTLFARCKYLVDEFHEIRDSS